jgi:MSHA pilin protein MshA
MPGSGQRGFTMIELVVIVVILAITAAFAVPRFIGLESQARIAALDGMSGNIRSAANMAHGVWIANGNISPLTIDGKPIKMINGYPDAQGLLDLIEDTSSFTTKVTTGAGTATFTPNGAPTATADTCTVVYTQASSAGEFTLTVQTPARLQSSC